MSNQKAQAQVVIPTSVLKKIAALAMTENPLECCGFLIGELGSDVALEFHACRNTAQSKIIYTVDPKEHLRIELDAEARGLAIIGVVHSHTHTEPYPSPTDVAQAPDPAWHYVIIGLKREAPETRSYRIVDGQISESQIILG
ncbi:MAG: M67 family metallopeptidase [Ilumatobacteraceae bacterium]|jgi:proteasome lid subunit RPN8/RPN11|nr:M67 family metallopeptidase [Ilumatobacteraceae bacterium]